MKSSAGIAGSTWGQPAPPYLGDLTGRGGGSLGDLVGRGVGALGVAAQVEFDCKV